MSNTIILSELFAELPQQQQDLRVGDTKFELTSSKNANKLADLERKITTLTTGNTNNSIGKTSVVNTVTQDLWRWGVPTGATVGTLSSFASVQGHRLG